MSQHDLEITTADTDTGVGMRAALNEALQALASNSSGATAPTVTYANMFWLDTSTGNPSLKQRDSINASWIDLYQLSATQWLFLKDIVINGATIGLGGGSVGSNVAFGVSALVNNTTGANNVAVGTEALVSNTTGLNNVALGFNTLRANVMSHNNIAIGSQSLYSQNFNGAGMNVSIGVNAMFGNISGYNNVAIGRQALRQNTTNSNNTAVGDLSLDASTGPGNCAFGSNSAYKNSTGSNNVAMGYFALFNNTTGDNNIALGYSAGALILAGTSNSVATGCIYIGKDTKASASGNTNEIVIGYGAIGKGSNTVTLGNDSILTTVLKGTVKLNSVPGVHADNAAAIAAGHVAGELYRTATGVLMVVY
jgi:hypothetical protein